MSILTAKLFIGLQRIACVHFAIMKHFIFLLVLMLVANLLLAQQKLINMQLPQMPDSLKTSWLTVDSIRTEFNNAADSLQTGYQHSIGKIETERNTIQHQIDSLENIGLPSNKFTQKLDSLTTKKREIDDHFSEQSTKLKSKTIGNLDKVEMTPELRQQVDGLTGKVNDFNPLKNDFSKIPVVQVRGYQLPKLSSTGDFPGIQTPLENIADLSKNAGAVGEDIKNITSGNLNDVKHIPQAIEQQALKNDGIQQLQKSSQLVNNYKEQVSKLSSAEGLQQQGTDMLKKETLNHFAGKDNELKAAMDRMSTYKQKYSSVKSIKDLPRRPPNAMKGKPFIERLVPGAWLQFQVKNAWLIDVNPYVGYKISGRFTTGIGWNQRYGYERKFARQLQNTGIWGPRAFLDFKLGRGFIGHLEQEVMNTLVPANLAARPEVIKREWVWSTMLGVKKQYRIYKNLNGTVLIQYNLFNPNFKAPYLDRLNSRMGLEYVLRKKTRRTK
jgi:hypothetical protein